MLDARPRIIFLVCHDAPCCSRPPPLSLRPLLFLFDLSSSSSSTSRSTLFPFTTRNKKAGNNGNKKTPREDLASLQSFLSSLPLSPVPRPSSISDNLASSSFTPPSSFLIDDGGPPRFYSPIPPREAVEGRSKNASELPLLFFLPGIDGVGLAAARQWPKLAPLFDLRVMAVPADDRTSLDGLIEIVAAAIEAEGRENIPQSRPIYLAGESFGASLALLVAARARGLVDRLLVINPATSYSRSAWSTIAPLIARAPSPIYGALPLALAPALGNPLSIMSGAVSASWASSPAEAARQLAGGASELLPQLRALGGALPAATLEWRLGLIEEAEARLLGRAEGGIEGAGGDDGDLSSKKKKARRPLLNDIKQRTLVIAGGNDTLLPSSEEADRLEKAMPRAKKVLLPSAGHALLQEGGVDLGSIVVEQGFYSRERRFSNSAPVAAGGVAARPRTRTSGGGAADPVDLPTPKELDNWTERATSLSRRLTSPVFFSFGGKKGRSGKEDDDETTTSSFSSDQTFVRGLGGIPTDARPILFIGNHQLMALDMGVLVEELYREKDILMRGLAHPAIFSRGGSDDGDEKGGEDEKKKEGSSSSNASSSSPSSLLPRFPSFFGNNTSGNSEDRSKAPKSANRFEAFMTEWGAVPVSARNFFKLMSQGEAVLLFPGGAREAYKRRGEDYALFWPEKSEFVRMVRGETSPPPFKEREREREREEGREKIKHEKNSTKHQIKNQTKKQASKFNGIIVPFAAVGCEDSIALALDSDELVNLPVVGPWIAERARASIPPARRGVSASEDVEGLFLTPLAVPKGLPERQYFLFREPIQLERSLADDREAAQEVYAKVKREVEDGISWLREKREADEYRFAAARLGYEIAAGSQAPTFDPSEE